MAEPAAFADATTTLIGPKGSGIVPLPACVTESTVVTCWKLTPLEVQEILKTGLVWIHVLGTSVLPMAVSGHDPFGPTLPPGHVAMGK